ncbi:MAG: copper chaperone PCu(A)C [Proteobacteria bacterium]|nr:copper chaperone PCu(A)C [Pseudomonadota bacterium]
MKIKCWIFYALLALLLPSMALAGNQIKKEIELSDFYVRAVPPGAENTALFITLTNPNKTDVVLSKVSSPVCRAAEIHLMQHKAGVMSMEHVPELAIKGGDTLKLSPDGYHIMLIGLKKTLKDGDSVPVTLSFKDGNKVKINATVRRLMKKMKHSH